MTTANDFLNGLDIQKTLLLLKERWEIINEIYEKNGTLIVSKGSVSYLDLGDDELKRRSELKAKSSYTAEQ